MASSVVLFMSQASPCGRIQDLMRPQTPASGGCRMSLLSVLELTPEKEPQTAVPHTLGASPFQAVWLDLRGACHRHAILPNGDEDMCYSSAIFLRLQGLTVLQRHCLLSCACRRRWYQVASAIELNDLMRPLTPESGGCRMSLLSVLELTPEKEPQKVACRALCIDHTVSCLLSWEVMQQSCCLMTHWTCEAPVTDMPSCLTARCAIYQWYFSPWKECQLGYGIVYCAELVAGVAV